MHMNRTDYDVVIVGARCAGAATAMLLARQGVRVLVVDRAAETSDTLSTHALMRGGVLQLRRWGLLDPVISAGTPAIRQTEFHYGNVVTNITIKPALGVDALYAPRRTVLDPLLVAAARQAGAQFRFGVTLTDLLRDGDERVNGIIVTDTLGRSTSVRAALVIGADGRRSRVARCVRAPVERQGSHASAIVYGYVAGLGRHTHRWFFEPGVTAGAIPTNDGLACVFAGTTPSRFRREIATDVNAGFQTLLDEASADLAEAVRQTPPVDRLRSFPGQAGTMRKPYGAGWALVGDAGGFKDPLSSHGITDAFRDAELLADAVVESLDERGRDAEAMRAFHQLRDDLSTDIFHAADAMASYTWDTRTIEQILRTLSAAMTDEVMVLAERDDPKALAQAI